MGIVAAKLEHFDKHDVFVKMHSVPNEEGNLRLQLVERLSTDGEGIAKCLGLQGEANVELEEILKQLAAKISARTRMSVEQPPPAASLMEEAVDDES